MKSSRSVTVSQHLNIPADKFWKVITQPQHMRSWFFDNIPDFKPEKGFETNFMVDAGERKFLHLWKLLEVVPERKIVYDWRYEGYAGVAKVTFELFPVGEQTKLTVTHKIIKEFPQDIPEFSRKSCQQGWDYFIKNSLVRYLQKPNQA